MTRFIVTNQQDHQPTQHKEALAEGLKSIADETFEQAPAGSVVNWNVIPKGFGFTAGELSSSTIVLCGMPDSTENSKRVAFMERINDLWVQTTGIDSNKLAIFTTSALL